MENPQYEKPIQVQWKPVDLPREEYFHDRVNAPPPSLALQAM